MFIYTSIHRATHDLFVSQVPAATTFVKIPMDQSLKESRALQMNVKETKRATKTAGVQRGRWYVTKYDRHLLRKCGWILGMWHPLFTVWFF